MLRSSREVIYKALFTQLKTVGAPFKYYTRRVRLWGDINSDQRPALVQIEPEEDIQPESSGRPPNNTLYVNILLIADAGGNTASEATPPISVLNNLLDAVETALRPDALTWKQTLGGVVEHAWIEGKIIKDSGDLDGTAVALIPVRLSVPA